MIEDVTAIAAKLLSVPPDQLPPETGPGSIPEWDSLRTMEIFLDIEDRWGISFSDDEVASLDSLRAIADAVARKTGHDA